MVDWPSVSFFCAPTVFSILRHSEGEGQWFGDRGHRHSDTWQKDIVFKALVWELLWLITQKHWHSFTFNDCRWKTCWFQWIVCNRICCADNYDLIIRTWSDSTVRLEVVNTHLKNSHWISFFFKGLSWIFSACGFNYRSYPVQIKLEATLYSGLVSAVGWCTAGISSLRTAVWQCWSCAYLFSTVLGGKSVETWVCVLFS